jgi:hypothetical protein
METERKTDTGDLRPSPRMRLFSLKSTINQIQESIFPPDLSMTLRLRRYFLLAFSLLLIFLAAGSRPNLVGDGPEYLAIALNLSRFNLPAISPGEMARIEERYAQLGVGFGGILVDNSNLIGSDGRQDFPHFWFYPALAAPPVLVTRALSVHPYIGFTIVNIALLLLALWVVSGRLNWTAVLLLFGGPILWWIDKCHTEVFTFSLLAIAFSLLRERPWWSLVCLGAASTQNPAVVPVLAIAAVMALITVPGALRDIRFLAGAIAGIALAALPTLYYLSRLGIPTPLLETGGGPRLRVPTLAEFGAVLWDPNLGILPAFPAWTVVLLVAGAALLARAFQRLKFQRLKAFKTDAEVRPERGSSIDRARSLLKAPAVWVALPTIAIFLLSFAQITNFNHGGTPGISRYGIWLIPLTIPLLQEADAAFSRKLRLWLAPVAIASLVWCVVLFHPNLPESSLKSTRLATFLWTHYPSLNNPLPEVFFERLAQTELLSISPIATAGCSKALLVGDRWPVNCLPEDDIPSRCLEPGTLCYANRTADGYEFVKAPGGPVYPRGVESYSIGERISFAEGGNGDKYTGLGWSSGGAWTWTDRPSAVVTLKLADIPDRDLALSIEGFAFLTDKHPVQEIDVLVNRHPVGTLHYAFPSSIDTRVITIPQTFIHDKRRLLTFEFKIKNPKSPADLGINGDTRALGLGVVSLRLE